MTDNIHRLRQDERPQDVLKIFHLTIPLKIYYDGLQYDQSDENRSSGYWMVKISFYLSADKVDKDNDDGHRKYFDINSAVYLEINDSGKNIDNRNTAFEYNYTQA